MFVTTFNICMIHIRNEDFTVGSRTYSVIAIWELLTFFYKGWVTFIPLFRIKTTTGVPGPGVINGCFCTWRALMTTAWEPWYLAYATWETRQKKADRNERGREEIHRVSGVAQVLNLKVKTTQRGTRHLLATSR